MEIFAFGFMQRAFLCGTLVAATCAALGVFLVLRRESMLGHGLAELTFAGVALGMLLNFFPMLTAVAVVTAGSLLMLNIRKKAALYGDTAVGILAGFGLAVGILMVSVSGGMNVDLFSYLFGNILAIDRTEVMLSALLAVIVLAVLAFYYRQFLYITFDEESSRAAGLKVDRLSACLTVLTALTVVLAMKVAGLLLVAALVVIPAAAGLQVAGSFRQAIFFSAGVGVLSVWIGLIAAYYCNLPPAGVIVLCATLFFSVLLGVRRLRAGD